MGCTQSAINNEPTPVNNNNNAQKSKNNANKNGADTNGVGVVPKTNPYIALSAKDLYSLKASWKGIRRSLEETGTLMFTK